MKNILLATMFVASIASAAQASSLGRLFFTPEQRAQLDYAHARSIPADGGSSSGVIVNGIVQRHGGPRTAWINGVPQKAGNSDDRSPDALPVAVPGRPRPVKIKVGQKLLLEQPAPQSTIETDK